jgi:hypothetical protein
MARPDVCSVPTDQRGGAIGGEAKFAGDGSDVGGCRGCVRVRQAQKLLHPARMRGRPGRQPKHDPGGQHRRTPQHLLGVVGQGL